MEITIKPITKNVGRKQVDWLLSNFCLMHAKMRPTFFVIGLMVISILALNYLIILYFVHFKNVLFLIF